MDAGNDFLNVVGRFWVKQGLVRVLALDMGTGELRPQPIADVPFRLYKLSEDDVVSLKHFGLCRWLSSSNPEQPLLHLVLTNAGFEEMLRRATRTTRWCVSCHSPNSQEGRYGRT